MIFRVAVVGVWAAAWALLGYGVLDPETLARGGRPDQFDDRAVASIRTVVPIGAIVGGAGGILAVVAARSKPYRALGVAVLVGVVVAGASQAIHGARHPPAAHTPAAAAPGWANVVSHALFGAAIGAGAGVPLMGAVEVATRGARVAGGGDRGGAGPAASGAAADIPVGREEAGDGAEPKPAVQWWTEAGAALAGGSLLMLANSVTLGPLVGLTVCCGLPFPLFLYGFAGYAAFKALTADDRDDGPREENEDLARGRADSQSE